MINLSKLLVICVGTYFISIVSHAETAVGVLKSKQHVVEIYTGENGPLYSVKNIKGELLASKLTDEDVLDKFPVLEPMIRGYADDASLSPKRNNVIDVLQHEE